MWQLVSGGDSWAPIRKLQLGILVCGVGIRIEVQSFSHAQILAAEEGRWLRTASVEPNS